MGSSALFACVRTCVRACVVSNLPLKEELANLVCTQAFWGVTYGSVFCMVVRHTSKLLGSPHVLCPPCHTDGDWEPVRTVLME